MAQKAMRWWVRRDSDGTYAGEGMFVGDTEETLADVQARAQPGTSILDASTEPRPPDPPRGSSALRTEYAGATLDSQRIDVIARRLGLK